MNNHFVCTSKVCLFLFKFCKDWIPRLQFSLDKVTKYSIAKRYDEHWAHIHDSCTMSGSGTWYFLRKTLHRQWITGLLQSLAIAIWPTSSVSAIRLRSTAHAIWSFAISSKPTHCNLRRGKIITLKPRGEFLHEQQLEEDEPPSCTDHHPLVLMENSYLANHALVLLWQGHGSLWVVNLVFEGGLVCLRSTGNAESRPPLGSATSFSLQIWLAALCSLPRWLVPGAGQVTAEAGHPSSTGKHSLPGAG